jgi:hypothetical protein
VQSHYLHSRGLPCGDSFRRKFWMAPVCSCSKESELPTPDFYPMMRNLGFNNLPDQSTMGAITFSDVVVSHEPFSDGLLFHELVHVEQYRQLGIPRFSELYVRGFLSGGSYEAIPLEVNAYSLEDRFRSAPRKGFSVQSEVEKWLAGGRLG